MVGFTRPPCDAGSSRQHPVLTGLCRNESFFPTAGGHRRSTLRSMQAVEKRTCPTCQGPLAQAFVGQHPRRRRFICPKCDTPLEPILPSEEEAVGKEAKPRK
jgi:hypothetical protein